MPNVITNPGRLGAHGAGRPDVRSFIRHPDRQQHRVPAAGRLRPGSASAPSGALTRTLAAGLFRLPQSRQRRRDADARAGRAGARRQAGAAADGRRQGRLQRPDQPGLPGARRAADRRPGVADRVQWTGFTSSDQVSANLLAADCAVLPYREGASLRHGSLMAALAHGLPIVSTQASAGSEADPGLFPMLRDGESALLVPPEDPVRLAAAVERVMIDPVLRLRLSQAAQGFRSSSLGRDRPSAPGGVRQTALACWTPVQADLNGGAATAAPLRHPHCCTDSLEYRSYRIETRSFLDCSHHAALCDPGRGLQPGNAHLRGVR